MPNPIGYLDQITGSTVLGWAYDGPRVIEVEIFIGGTSIGKVRADQPRADLFVAGIGNGHHSFRCPIPSGLRFTRDTPVIARAAGLELSGSGRSVQTLLIDQSLLFDENGALIVSDRSPLLLLDELTRLRAPDLRPFYSPAVNRLVDDALGKTTDTYDLDTLATLAASLASANYAMTRMARAERRSHAYDQLGWALERAPSEGLVLEFGVFGGTSINYLAQHFPNRTIFGFDSFKGLPEDWSRIAPKGTLAMVKLPDVLDNVCLVVGWFDETLPKFCREHCGERVALLHIDCDVYSSTKTIFDCLENSIRVGTIIVFDEYFNYPGWEDHEYRAFQEFIARSGLKYEYLSFVPSHKQVCVHVVG